MMEMITSIGIIVLALEISHCFAQSDGTFLIYNAQKNKCVGDVQLLLPCNPHSTKQQFRWTTESRVFNVAQKKCLGAGRKAEGNSLQWYICDPKSDLQKWECKDNLLFSLKNESLHLSVQRATLLTLAKDPGEEGKWTIHGTQENICSRPVEELYTIKGNALGRPCHFPFLFNDKWYTDCTTDGSPTNHMWCAVESDYKVNGLWGFCPTSQIDTSWSKNPLTGVYYQVYEDAALTWYQARKSCLQQGADLLSISEPHEQAFITGVTLRAGQALWTGLNNLDSSSGWQWINGQPFRYLKWLSGQPSSQPGHNCGVINQHDFSQWSTDICSAKHGYICQKSTSAPTIPAVVHTGSCPSPWIPYSGHCYLLNRIKRTWFEAKDACRRDGGDLLSVLNTEEQSFVITQLGYVKTDELWIGFNDLKTPMLFEWSDHSTVPFTWWEKYEPSHNAALKEDCVIMNGEEGKWADKICQQTYGYICKKTTSLKPSTNDTVVTSPGCKSGWIRYGYYCYLAGTETKSFEEAKQMCEKSGSYLADITNIVENAFMVSLVGARPEKHFWIGLSNQRDRHTFEWTENSKVSFTHFNAGMPGRRQGCVAMTTGMFAGLWDVLSCTDKEKYICKQKAEGVVTTEAAPTSPAPSCSQGWFPLTNRDFCFKLFRVMHNQMKTWSEALDFCRELGGDLLSIHSNVDISPDYMTLSPYPAWIGYSIQNPAVGYVWSDGSASSFENWEDDEPNNFNNVENCATMRMSWSRVMKWNDLHCEDKEHWFCEIRKGVMPKEVNISMTTYNTTDDGWIIFRDNQYYIGQRSVSMKEAQTFCKQKHGDLVVINDEEERVFLWHQAKNNYDDMYIGMQIDLDKTFTWIDGSPVVFQAWSQNQPAFANDEEHCVKMTRSQGLWESLNCGDEENFICKRKGSPPVNATVAPTEPIGGCAPGWSMFQGKCYQIQPEPKRWTEARSYCRGLGGDLVSITTRLLQAFLILRMNENTPDLWIGFSNLAGSRFKWTDGSSVGFTNWAKGQPTQNYVWYHISTATSCVVMGAMHRAEMGKWVSNDCNDTSGFICSRAVDHLIKPSPTETPTDFVELRNSSYMVVQRNLTWTEAKLQCEAVGARLASIRDMMTQSYLELQTNELGQPMWIGLNRMETDGYFLWIDNWHLNMEKWHYKEPKKDDHCVYMDVDGDWKTSNCNQTHYSVCKKSTEIAPTPPTQYPGECPEESEDPVISWLPYKGHCYAFMYLSTTWSSASLFCKTKGANLVSIEDTNEAKFLENYIDILGNDDRHFWIGLFQTSKGHWLWLDDSVVDYTNWGGSSDDDVDEYFYYYENKNCASISTRSKKWRQSGCEIRARFICKAAKVITMNTEVTPTEPVKQPGNAAAVSVVVVMVVLCVLAGMAYLYHSRRVVSREPPAGDAFENPTYHSTVEPLPMEKDTKTLVAHMEVNEKHPPL